MTNTRQIKKHTILHYLVTLLFVFVKSLIGAVIWIIAGGVGYLIFKLKHTPYDLIFGLPLILIGAGLTINSLISALNALFSPKYNEAVCPFCSSK